VVSHGTETGDTSERESSKSSHGEVITVNLTEVLLEDTVDLVAAKGSGDKGGFTVSVWGKSILNLSDEVRVGHSLWVGRENLIRALWKKVRGKELLAKNPQNTLNSTIFKNLRLTVEKLKTLAALLAERLIAMSIILKNRCWFRGIKIEQN
jgi:hypothetical protein